MQSFRKKDLKSILVHPDKAKFSGSTQASSKSFNESVGFFFSGE